jgi:sugar O-acyltransferase (sialic acid O-acetyltransferase NeuD family)
MKSKIKIMILGTGGTSKDILDIVKDLKYQCVGFLDDDKDKWGKFINGVEILGPLKNGINYKDTFFINGIGNPANFLQKGKIIQNTKLSLTKFITLIHPSASISGSAFLGSGTIVFQNVVISSNAKIGNHVVILPNSVIGHDNKIGDYTCIASGVCISGLVKVGKLCYLGTGSVIKEGTTIADRSLVGMGSVVLNNIEEESAYVGNPAKFLRKINK